MGLWNVLEKAFDVVLSFADSQANSIDRMSDKEIKEKYKNSNHSVEEWRDLSDTIHDISSRRKDRH